MLSSMRASGICRLSFAMTMLAAAGVAQCATSLRPTLQVPGTNGVVRALHVWDPDGAGPRPAVLIVGGSFTLAGDVPVANLAAFDMATGRWSAIGLGVTVGANASTAEVRALATASNGDLLIGGDFTFAGGAPGHVCLTRWNGTAFAPIGTIPTPVEAIAVRPNGTILVGGDFTFAGTSSATRVASFDGVQWSALGNGCNATVRALAVMANGDVVAGGDFTSAGTVPAARVARWNGTAWSALGTGVDATVRALAVQGTTLFAGGDFTSAGGTFARGVASWNGTAWQVNVNNLRNDGRVFAIATSATEVYLAGSMVGAGAFPSLAASFDGSFWNALEANDDATSIAHAVAILPGGGIAIGGAFDNIDHGTAANLAFGPRTWFAPGVLNGFVGDVAMRADGTLVVAGEFHVPGIAGTVSLASFDGAQWTSHDASLGSSRARHLLALPNGEVWAATNTVGLNSIYRWNGAGWTPQGPLSVVAANAFALAGNDLIAAGLDSNFNAGVWRWNGTAWSQVGGLLTGQLEAVASLPGGDLVVSSSGGSPIPVAQVWRWNGTTWSQVGANLQGIRGTTALAPLPNGDLVLAGTFATQRWNGSTWAPLGTGAAADVKDLLVLPNGDLLAVGSFQSVGNVSAANLARWDGSTWTPVTPGTDRRVLAATMSTRGEVVLVGEFGYVGTAASPSLTRLASSCPAAAIAFGAPCIGANGPMQLRADTLPWLGGTLRTTTTGFAPTSLGVRVLGLQVTALPLALLHPVGLANCALLARPDDVALLTVNAGNAASALAIPVAAPLVGTQLFAQTLQLELDPQLQPTALLASNALLLTLGVF